MRDGDLTLESVRLVDLARPELLDGLRNRRQLVARALAPVVLLVAIAALGLLTGEVLNPEPGKYRVAVAGDVDGGVNLVASLAAADLRVETAPDAALAVAGSADAALVLPPDTDDALADGEPLAVTLVSDATNLRSRAAAVETRLVLVELSAPLPDGVTIERILVQPTSGRSTGGGSQVLAQGAAALVLVQGGVLIGSAAARLARRRGTGQLAPMLVLAIPRSRLVTARALTDTALGLVAGAPLVALALLAGVGVRLHEGDPLGAAWAAVVVPAAAAAVALPLVSVGLIIGARAAHPSRCLS